ncbi:MAG: molybdopterin biosynthesis protein, partial [Chloroflexi bacterium]|nr:molybdopterin biosynthesis protein [Chloroflexota bacterium]
SQLVLPAGHQLRPVDLGAIAASGHAMLTVARKPRVAVIPTGSELVEIGTEVQPGDILEYNSLVLAAQIEAWGGSADRLEIVSDDIDHIKQAVASSSQNHDLILLNAGSSAGTEDYSAQVVESLGQLLVHGVAVRPGHPVILGMIDQEGGRQVPIIGVPGYPVSAALTGEIFVQPLLAMWLGRQLEEGETIDATLTRKIASPAGDDDYVRVTLGRVGERMLAAPLSRGAGVISSLVRADGLALLPRGSQGEEAGAQVSVKLYRSARELERTIFVIGSHDIALDLFAQYLAQKDRRLTSANVGSLGGLVALQRGEAHLAGSHLLDPESGEYNLAYLEEYLQNVPVRVVGLVMRQQGLIVKSNNPKGIDSLKSLEREDIVFINRQRGAGTRVRLDYELDKLGIDSNNVQGYNREEYTHLGLAAAVASGRADCGLGIAAAAHALNLDFVPLFEERYDLIIPLEFFDSPLLAPLIKLFDSKVLRTEIDGLPGYSAAPFGKIIATVE